MKLGFSIPIATVNPLNKREHWRARSRRVMLERAATHWVARKAWSFPDFMAPPFVVTLTRVCRRRFDSDAVPGALKSVRDEIAKVLGVTDGINDKRVEWRYGDQELGEPSVRVTIEAKT